MLYKIYIYIKVWIGGLLLALYSDVKASWPGFILSSSCTVPLCLDLYDVTC